PTGAGTGRRTTGLSRSRPGPPTRAASTATERTRPSCCHLSRSAPLDTGAVAQGLRPRGADRDLAMAISIVLPSASVNGVGAPTRQILRLDPRPARAPVPRFTDVLAGADAGLGVVVGRYNRYAPMGRARSCVARGGVRTPAAPWRDCGRGRAASGLCLPEVPRGHWR